MSSPEPTTTYRRALPLALIVTASIIAFLALFSLWANRQFLNTDNWTDTSSQVLESEPVRTQLASFLVDELYQSDNVQQTIRDALPPRAAGLAGPASGALREAAERGVREALQRPRVQAAWEQANRRAHQELLRVLDGGGSFVSTGNGEVTIDLRALVLTTADRLGVRDKVEGRLPPTAGQITVLKSKQLAGAQDGLKVLRHLPVVLLALMLVLFALALWSAGAYRRRALRACGFGLVAAGIAALLTRNLVGGQVVDSLATTASTRPAVEDVWTTASSMLREAAVATILYGILVVLGAWMAGPSAWAVGLRAELAPYLREPAYAYGGLAVIVALGAWWAPTPATRQLVGGLLLVALLVLGLEALRRQTAREHPDLDRDAAATRRRANATRVAAGGRRVMAGVGTSRTAAAPASGDRFVRAEDSSLGDPEADQLERLAGLHADGVLDDEEFRRAKENVLGRVGHGAG
jgi:hypothetical protein